jgi:predicted acylesterase/phospholipase RssA
MSKSCEKSVQEECCKTSDVQNPSESCGHTNPLAPTLAPAPSSLGLVRPNCSSNKPLSILPPRRIALCGGGMRGIVHIGCMKALASAGLLSCVKEMIGISAGALFALLYVIGFSLEDLERLALELDFVSLINIEPENLFFFPETFGLDGGEGLERLLKSVLFRKGFDPDITFRQLAAARPSAPAFRCFATELKTIRIREFSIQQTPDIPIRIAVRASMSLPILFTPVRDPITGHILVDGGVLHNLPLVFMDDAHIGETLAVFFEKGGSGSSSSDQTDIPDVISMFQHLYDSITYMRNRIWLAKHKDRIITVPVDRIGALQFGESRENRQRMISYGFDCAQKFLARPGKKPARRYSCS